MIKIKWHKVVTREFSFLWASYTISVYKIMKKMTGTELRHNLFYTQKRILTIYREEKDVQKSYELINKLAQKNPTKILTYMNICEDLVKQNYELMAEIKKTKNKSELKSKLIKLDKLFLKTITYYLYVVFLGYGGHLAANKKIIKKHKQQFEKIRSITLDMDMHDQFPKLFAKFDPKLKPLVLYMTRQELTKYLKGQKLDWIRIKNRKKEALIITKNAISGEYPSNRIKEALKFELKHLKIDKEVKTIKGSITCKGRVEGPVVIIFRKADYKKIKRGDIVVTPMTKPEIVPYLKKAKGIITNDGGALCHASIISREMKLPCIVGTSYATDILKNKEKIILDANKGIIKRK